jgi:tRNA nucleotidyltransferase (CCA-adding enzyme)
LSFVDDATRILRAARLEQRLSFHIEARTAELIADGLPMLDRVSGERIRHELELALREPDPMPVFERLQELGVLEQLHPSLAWTAEAARHFSDLQGLLQRPIWQEALEEASPASVYFALWMATQSEGARQALMERLNVRKSTREEVQGVVHVVQLLKSFEPGVQPSAVEHALRPYAAYPRILLAARAVLNGDPSARLLQMYQSEWRHERTLLDGNDLREMGLKPGPQYARLLDRLLAARLDGELSSEQEERAYLAQLLEGR